MELRNGNLIILYNIEYTAGKKNRKINETFTNIYNFDVFKLK